MTDSIPSKSSSGNFGKVMLDGSLRILTMLKRVTVTYSSNNGQQLPGFMPKPKYIGLDDGFAAPGWDFVLGAQPDIYNKAVNNDWLTLDSIISDPYRKTSSSTLNYRVNCEPFQGFKIDIQGNQTEASNFQQYFRADANGIIHPFTPTNGGNFNASTLLLRTAFIKDYGDGNDGSPTFDKLLANRAIIAERIAKNNPQWVSDVQSYYFDTIAGSYFPVGYGASTQEVVMYSFLAAYTGQDASSIKLSPFMQFPLPNWSITYNGLTNIPAVASIFKTVNLTHTYRSTYTLSNWASNVY